MCAQVRCSPADRNCGTKLAQGTPVSVIAQLAHNLFARAEMAFGSWNSHVHIRLILQVTVFGKAARSLRLLEMLMPAQVNGITC